MIPPTTTIQTLVDKTALQNETILPDYVVDVKEMSEDSAKNLQKPYVGIYADFDLPAELSANKTPLAVPVSVYAQCCSSEKETAAESFKEAFLMAVAVMRIIRENYGEYVLQNPEGNDELIRIDFQDVPMVVLRKSAQASVISLQFKYDIRNIMGL
ncbi:MAG: hypothetical protein IPM56_16200 [Ignavibacteriales bacterium]|nr:MAG: hypothetical protein IPM56_16200 [Ignavibacteriales bacterium]